MTTLSELTTMLSEDYVRDPRHSVWNIDTKKRAINKWYTRVQADLSWWDSESDNEYSFNTVSWTETYALPSDFVNARLVTVDSNPLTRETKEKVKWISVDPWTSRSYYLSGGNIWLFPVPNKSLSVVLYYQGLLPLLTDAIDSALPTQADDAILLFAAYKLFVWVRDQNGASLMIQEYNNAIDMIRSQLLFNDSNMTFWISR
jgi:hypothetical protein